MQKINRRAAMAALGASAVAVAVSTSARAATAPVVVAASSATGDFGKVAVLVRSVSAVTGLKAHVLAADGAELDLLEGFDLHSGTAFDGIWHSRERAQLPALGFFRMEIEATSADGGYAYARDNPDLQLQYLMTETWADVAAAPSTVDEHHRTVTVTGRCLGRHPGGDTFAPRAGEVVSVTPAAGGEVRGSTKADGSFSISVAPQKTGTLRVESVRDGVYHAGVDLPIAMIVTPVRMSVELSATKIHLGGSVEVRGLLEHQVNGAWQPYPAQPVSGLWQGIVDRAEVGPFVTDAQGVFTAAIAVPDDVTSFSVAFNQGRIRDEFVGSASAAVPVSLIYPVEVVDFGATPLGGGWWAFAGYVEYDHGVLPASTQVQLQVKPSGATTWTTVRIVTPDDRGERQRFDAQLKLTPPCRVRAYVAAQGSFAAGASAERSFGAAPRRATRIDSGAELTPRRR